MSTSRAPVPFDTNPRPHILRKSTSNASGKNKTNEIFNLLTTQAIKKLVNTMQESSGADTVA